MNDRQTLFFRKIFLTNISVVWPFVLEIFRPLVVSIIPSHRGAVSGGRLVRLRSCELPIAITRDGLFPFYSDCSFQRIQRYNKLPAFNVRFPSSCKIQNLPVNQMLLLGWLLTPEDHTWWKEGGSGHIASCYSINEQWICI